MLLRELGEFGLIQKISAQFSNHLPEGVEGIGDDCAIIPQSDEHSLLITTDLLIEDVHFLRRDIHPKNLGHKSLAINLSDIAAMGGVPQFAFLSVAFPLDLDTKWLDDFFAGFHELANSFQTYLVGGDTVKSKNGIVINVAIIGKIKTSHIKRRSRAKVGDFVCVTDFLGDSSAGLDCILHNRSRNGDALSLIKRHYLPRPQLEEGQWLSQHASVHAMIDVSDGIDSDLRRVMEKSRCGAELIVENIPISPALTRLHTMYRLNSIEFALTGGEDYCLLLTVDPLAYNDLLQDFQAKFKRPLYRIGKIVEAERGLSYLKNSAPFAFKGHGYDHFKS